MRARFQRDGQIREVALGDDRDARRDFCETQLALLDGGWQRISDAELDEPIVAELESALRANPDDTQTWLVYADHYIEHGHPRGPIMAIEAAPVKNIVHRAEREAQADPLRHAARDRLLGSLAGRSGLKLRWQRGFIHHAHVFGRHERGDAEELLWDLLRHPSARFLRELELDLAHTDAQDHRLLVALIRHVAPPLRKLAIDYAPMEWVGSPPLGPIGPLVAALPLLEELRLESDDTLDLRGLAIPRARSVAIRTDALRPATVAHFRAAPWPHLEHLDLWLANSTCTVDDLRFTLDGTLPRLRQLSLGRAAFANDIVAALLASPIAKQITWLDLAQGALDASAVDALVEGRDRLAHELRVHATVSTEQRERLHAADLWPDRWW